MPPNREEFDQDELSRVLERYDLGAIRGIRQFPRGAHASAKVLVVSDRGKFFLKRRPPGRVALDRMELAHRLQQHLSLRNYPIPRLVRTRTDDRSSLRLGDTAYELYEFVRGRPYDGGPTATFEAGRMLGLYHKLLRDFNVAQEPTQTACHDSRVVPDSLTSLRKALAAARPDAASKRSVNELAEALRTAYQSAAQAANETGLAGWPRQVVHGDWHPGNLLYRGSRVIAVLDHDSACIRQPVLDAANGCLQFSWVVGTRDLSTWREEADQDRVRQFLNGYDRVRVLSRAELKAIPHLMQEVIVAQSLPPILQTGTFAGLDGEMFLRVMLARIGWLNQNQKLFQLDSNSD